MIPHQLVRHLLCSDTFLYIWISSVRVCVCDSARAAAVTDLQEFRSSAQKKKKSWGKKRKRRNFIPGVCFLQPSPSSCLLLIQTLSASRTNSQPSSFTSLDERVLCVTVQRLTASRWCLLSVCNFIQLEATDGSFFLSFSRRRMFAICLDMFICSYATVPDNSRLFVRCSLCLQVNVCQRPCWANILLFTIPACQSSQPLSLPGCHFDSAKQAPGLAES